MDTVPDPSSSAPGDGKKGMALVLSQCALTMAIGSFFALSETGSIRTMMDVWAQVWGNGATVIWDRTCLGAALVYSWIFASSHSELCLPVSDR